MQCLHRSSVNLGFKGAIEIYLVVKYVSVISGTQNIRTEDKETPTDPTFGSSFCVLIRSVQLITMKESLPQVSHS